MIHISSYGVKVCSVPIGLTVRILTVTRILSNGPIETLLPGYRPGLDGRLQHATSLCDNGNSSKGLKEGRPHFVFI